jgi:hypothetical protein
MIKKEIVTEIFPDDLKSGRSLVGKFATELLPELLLFKN